VTVAAPPVVLFLGKEYAGHRTRFMNLRDHTVADGRIRPEYRNVSGWVTNGWLERVRILPPAIRGRMRATLEAAPVARFPRPDVIWSSADEVLAPYFWTQLGPLRRPRRWNCHCAGVSRAAAATTAATSSSSTKCAP